jgi:hypothetical protein
MHQTWQRLLALVFLLTSLGVASAGPSTNLLIWSKAGDRVTADVRGWPLLKLLEAIAAQSGWQVLVEPDLEQSASVKFKNLPYGEALRLLLGDLNYALVPQTNGATRFYVFRTTLDRATQLVRAASDQAAVVQPKRVPNELIVRIKPGTDIDQLARLFGAKVTGRIPDLNAYRLEFPDEAAADTARRLLADTTGVASVDYNYYFERPQPTREFTGAGTAALSLQLKPPGDSGRVIVGLVDTAVQPLGGSLDAFLLKQLSVAGPVTLDPNSPMHGTSMAETILRSLEEVTKGSTSVQILPVDVYGANRETTTWNVALGIVAAVNGGANPINLSLGSSVNSPVLQELVASVAARGIVLFAAAGNEPVTTPVYPAAYPEVTAVTGGNKTKISSYANFGSFVDVAAPDANIVSYANRQWYVVGTSAATAFTTGTAAGLADKTAQSWNNILRVIQQNFPVPATGAK